MSGGGIEEEAPERQRENRNAEMQRLWKDGASALRQPPPEDGEGWSECPASATAGGWGRSRDLSSVGISRERHETGSVESQMRNPGGQHQKAPVGTLDFLIALLFVTYGFETLINN